MFNREIAIGLILLMIVGCLLVLSRTTSSNLPALPGDLVQRTMSIPPNSKLNFARADQRTVALLELTTSLGALEDERLQNTINLASEALDYPVPIYNTQGSVERTLQLLTTQYQAGKRIFIGFSRSSFLAQIKSWFDQHPDALAISVISTAPSLSIRDNILRLTPNDRQAVWPFVTFATSRYQRILILVEEGDLASTELGRLIQQTATIPTQLEFVDLSMVDGQPMGSGPASAGRVLEWLRTIEPGVLLMPFFLEQRSLFWEVYQEAKIPSDRGDLIESVGSNPPTLPVPFREIFNRRYFFLSAWNRETAILRNLRQREPELSANGYDAVLLAKTIDSSLTWSSSPTQQPKSVDLAMVRQLAAQTCGVGGYLDLTPTGDRQFADFLIQQFSMETGWHPFQLYLNEPQLGRFIAVPSPETGSLSTPNHSSSHGG